MQRWLLLLPFLVLPLACDDNSNPPPAPSSSSGSTTAASCQVVAGNCTVDSDCCSGLTCNHDKHICQGQCASAGDSCKNVADCCGALACNGGSCQ